MSSVNEGDIKIEEPGPGYAVGSTTESPSLNSVATQEMANDPIERTNLQLTSTSSPPSPKVNEPNRGNASIEHLRRKQPRTRSTRYKCKRCESTFRDQHELDHHENVHVHRNWHETARSRAPTKRVRNVYRRPLKPRSPIWECGFCQITLASQNERHYHIRDCKAAKGINTVVASKRSVLEEGTQSLEHAKTWTWSWNTKTEAGTSLDIDTARHFVENDSCLKGLDDVFGPSISGKELFDLAPIAWSNSMPEEYSVFAHTPKRYSTLLHSSEELKSPSPKAPYCPVKDIFCPPPPPRHQNVSAASIDIPAPSLSTKSSKSSLDSGYWSQSVESCGTGGEMSMTGNPEKAGSLLSWLNDEEILPGRDEYVSQALFWFRDGKTSGGRENDQHLDYSLSQENRRWGTSASKESSGTGSLANLDAVPRKMKEQCGGWKGAADCNLVDRKGNDKTCSRTVSPASLGSTAVVSDSGRSQNTANDCGSDENHSSPHTSHSNRGSRSSSLRGSSVGDLTELDNSSGELCSTPGTSSASTEDTSSLFDTTNSLNSTDSSPSPPPAMETRKRKIIDHLMGCLEVFLATYDCHGEPRAVTKNGKSKSRATRAAESNSQSKEQLLVNTGIKRQRGDFTDDDAQDIDEINQPRVKRAKSPSTDIPSPLFACPYYKYNPRKYRRWRTCFGPGWRSVHRVK